MKLSREEMSDQSASNQVQNDSSEDSTNDDN